MNKQRQSGYEQDDSIHAEMENYVVALGKA